MPFYCNEIHPETNEVKNRFIAEFLYINVFEIEMIEI